MAEKTVAVIGGGVSGLCAVKIALEHGLKPTCYEQKEDIGGLWDVVHPYPDYLVQDGRVYSGLVQNNCKPYYSYSDFPPLKNHPYYMRSYQVKEYLCAYADEFNLRPHIQCGRQVKSVTKAQDYESTGKWVVTTVDAKTKGKESTVTFDAVFVCVGYYSKAKMPPKYPGQDDFKGTIIHAGKYWDPEPYKDKTVLMIGGSISSVDIGSMLSAGGVKQVYILSREGLWAMPQSLRNGRSWEDFFFHRGFRTTASFRKMQDDLYKICASRFDFDALGMVPDRPILQARMPISDDLDKWIYSGYIKCLKGFVESFTPDGVKLTNGDEVQVDHVIFTTGYQHDFPFMDEKDLIPEEAPESKWWQYMYPIEQQHPSMYLIGMFYVFAALPAIAELQLRAACGFVKGSLQVPKKEEMQKWIDAEIQGQKEVYGRFPGMEVDGWVYMVNLAELIGCYPTMPQLMRKSPKLAWKAWNGPLYPAHFRLTGPHAKPELAEKILHEVEENAFGVHSCSKTGEKWNRPLSLK